MADIPALTAPVPGPRDRALALLRRIIADGGLAFGDELPSVRELGRILDIPHSTVFRALRELEQHGLIERGTSGTLRVIGATGLAADLDREQMRPGELAQTVVVVLLGDAPRYLPPGAPEPTTLPVRGIADGWADRMVLGAFDRINELGHKPLLIRLRHLRPGDVDRLVDARPLGVLLPEVDHSLGDYVAVIERLRAAGIPHVIGCEGPGLVADSVGSDHAAGADQLVEWLHARGRRHLVQLLPERPSLTWPQERRQGYERTTTRLGLPHYANVAYTCIDLPGASDAENWRANRWYAMGMLVELLRAVPKVDGILCCTDPDVMVLAHALREHRREAQRDVDLVGYDNYAADHFMAGFEKTRPAATVDKDNLARGAAMADLLMQRLRGHLPPGPQHQRLAPRLLTPG
jgi:DNA-binding LacI/PurR family transcriptional regulator/DNA-binding transcriptional ArsR family regulator